jgi:hypothetical protein
MSLADDIRHHYPHPVEESRAEAGTYCIGGACLMFEKGNPITSYPNCERFPEEAILANTLQTYNPALSDREAYEFACSIIEHNDASRFEEGWAALDLASIRVSH